MNLFDREQDDFFSDRNKTREQYLREIFSKRIEFQRGGNAVHFVPYDTEDGDTYVVGRIGRQVVFNENMPPEENFDPLDRPG